MGGSRSSTRSDAQSTSESESFGFNESESGDVSTSLSQALGGGQSTSQQRIAFEDLYAGLFGGATAAAGRAAMGAPELASTASQLFTGGTQFLQNLGSNAGTDYMTGRLTGANPQLEQAIAALKADSASLFTDELNPAITSRAVAGGTLGGGRQGVAQGIAMGRANQQFTTQAAALRYGDIAAKDAIAANVAQNSIAAASTGLGALPGMLDLAERGNNAELGAFASLASILGGPTVLGESQSTNFQESTAQSLSEAFARAYGQQSATSASQSTATSRGRSRSFNFGFGLPEG